VAVCGCCAAANFRLLMFGRPGDRAGLFPATGNPVGAMRRLRPTGYYLFQAARKAAGDGDLSKRASPIEPNLNKLVEQDHRRVKQQRTRLMLDRCCRRASTRSGPASARRYSDGNRSSCISRSPEECTGYCTHGSCGSVGVGSAIPSKVVCLTVRKVVFGRFGVESVSFVRFR
jgi:hypothetical protein